MTAPSAAPSKRERLARILGSGLGVGVLKSVFRRPGVLCLTHHRVAFDVEHDPDVISATPVGLEQQAAWLSANVSTVSGADAIDALFGRRPLPKPAVALTFDDGYEDNFAAGQMLMRRFGIAATFFIPTAYIETGLLPPWDRIGFSLRRATERMIRVPAIDGLGPWQLDTSDYEASITLAMKVYRSLPPAQQPAFVDGCESAAGTRAPNGRSPFMTWDQIRQLRDMGHTIGAHTHTHPVLASLSSADQNVEIGQSKRILEQRLGSPVTAFAYPYGKPGTTFSAETQRIVEACGFSAAFSFYGGWNQPGHVDAFNVKRIKVDPSTSMSMFRSRVVTQGRAPV